MQSRVTETEITTMKDSLLKINEELMPKKRDPDVREPLVCLWCGNRGNNTLEKAKMSQYEKLSAINKYLKLIWTSKN